MSEVTKKELKPEVKRVLKRGEIYYIQEFPTCGSEQKPGRPGVIVSNDDCNSHSSVVEICYLTRRRKTPLPTHVHLYGGPCNNSTILCEQVTSVSVEKIGDFLCTIPENLVESLNEALRISLAIKESTTPPETVMDELKALKHENSTLREKLRLTEDANKTLKKTPATLAKQLEEAQSKADMYERMYNDLLDKLISRGVK